MRFRLAILLGVSILGEAAQNTNQHQRRQNSSDDGINWADCDIDSALLPLQCGTLMVPLDYTDESSEKQLQLKLVRLQAATTPSRGSILLNAGGPGAPGVAELAAFAPFLQAATGGVFDLINVIPRGTNDTLPFNCFSSEASRALATPPLSGNASNVALGQVWALATLYAGHCAAFQAGTGDLIGTAFVARDMIRVVDALGEDGMLRYWGVSYGTVLGSTMIAMFPDRVDKVILDGVVNPFEYYENEEVQLFTDSDAVFSGFCSTCVEAGEDCPLGQNQTAMGLEELVHAFLEELKYNPIAAVDATAFGGGSLHDYSLVEGYIYSELYYPSRWPILAATLSALMGTDTTSADAAEVIGKLDTAAAASVAVIDRPEALPGIKCSDVHGGRKSFMEMMPVLQARHEISRFGDASDQMPARCAQWGFRAKERYRGDFNVKTANPVLIIGNTLDPITPLVSAQNMTETLEDSVLLQHGSYGHTSQVFAGFCTAKAVRSYFVNGTMPEPGTLCPVDRSPFSGDNGQAEVTELLNADPNTT